MSGRRRRRKPEAKGPSELEQLRAHAEATARKAAENEQRMDRIAKLIRARSTNA